MTALLLPLLALMSAGIAAPESLSETVSVYRNLTFAEKPAPGLQLDLYVPKSAEGSLACIVVIPGGGFRPQLKDKFAAEAQRLAEAGFAAASIGYRGTPDDNCLATIGDTKAAVRYLRANAATYGIDPIRIGAFGQSAGGHLAGMLAVSGDNPELEGDGGNAGVSSKVQAAVTFAGVFDFISRLRDGSTQVENLEEKRKSNGIWISEPFSVDGPRWKLASPITHVSADDPPVLLVACKDDKTVPYQQSVEMYDALKAVRPASRLVLFDKGGHGIRTSPLVSEEAFAWTIAFFREHLAAPKPSAPAGPGWKPAIAPTHTDVKYGPYARNVMDVWEVKSPKPAPVLISIHGGGFRFGEKRIDNPLLQQCLDAGIAVVTITYRFSDEVIAPASFLDGARSVQFVRANAAAWNIDPTRIAANGSSAGAGISMWLAYHDDLADPSNVDPILRESSRLTCIAVEDGQCSYDPRFIRDLFPGTDTHLNESVGKLFGIDPNQLDSLPEEKYRLFESVAPINFVSAGDPPTLLTYALAANAPIITRGNGIHHPRFGYTLKEKLDPLGIPCAVAPGLATPQDRAPVIMTFLKQHLGVVAGEK